MNINFYFYWRPIFFNVDINFHFHQYNTILSDPNIFFLTIIKKLTFSHFNFGKITFVRESEKC